MNTESFFDNDQLHLIQHAQNGKVIGQYANQMVSPDATSTPAFGSTVIYEIQKSGDDLVDEACLVVDISAISGSGGTYIRGVNALALYIWKRIELVLDNKIKAVAYPDAIEKNIKYYLNSDKYSCVSQQLAIQAQATRDTLAGSAQKLVIPLKHLFPIFSKPLDRSMIRGTFTIRGYLKDNVRQCIQTDKTGATFSITNTYLDIQYIKAKPIILNTNRKMYNENNATGKPHFNIEHLIIEKQIASSSTSVVLSLPELINERVIDLTVFLRASALKETNDASDYTDTYIAPTSFNLKSGGKYNNYGVQEDITKSYYDRVILPRLEFEGWVNLLSGTASGNEFVISFANDHGVETSDEKRYHGARFITEKDFQLTVNFASLAAQTDIVVIARTAKRFVIKNGLIEDLNPTKKL